MTYEIKWGLGWIPHFQLPVKLYHVVINGKTTTSFTSEQAAKDYIIKHYGHVPLGKEK